MSVEITKQGDINTSQERFSYQERNWDTQTRNWIEEDSAYFLHQALSTPVMQVLSKTEGAYIYDLNGKQYLDMHGNGVHNAGFSNPKVIAAVKKQLDDHLAFTPRRYTNIPVVQLAKKLVAVSPEGLDRVLFCPGGAQAIEMAVMLAKQVTGKYKTISYWDSYHGTGFQAASVGGQEHFQMGNGPMVPGAIHVEFPNYYRNPWDWEDQDRIDEEYLRQIKLALQTHPDVAAVIGEPISATPTVPSKRYWTEIKEMCEQQGMLLIFDEIIEGFGRTGKLFACEHFVTPDVLVMGKSLGGGIVPLAGILTWDKYNVIPNRSIGHFTHEKNPLSAAAGLAEIESLIDDGYIENARIMGDYLMDRLLELKDSYPIVGNVAGLGMHIGIDLVRDRATKERATTEAEKIMFYCMEKGLAFKIIEGNVITLRPSLILDKSMVDFTYETLKSAFEWISEQF